MNRNPSKFESQHSNRLNRYSSDDEDEEETPIANKFVNDGSFLEMFKRMQEQQKSLGSNSNSNTTNLNTSLNRETGAKRPNETKDSHETKQKNTKDSSAKVNESSSTTTTKRKPKVLKTGVITKKSKPEDSNEADDSDNSAWSRYMREVKNYKEKYGDDGDKNRPLVK